MKDGIIHKEIEVLVPLGSANLYFIMKSECIEVGNIIEKHNGNKI